MLYCIFQPYEHQVDDNVQMFAQMQLFITLVAGMLIKSGRNITSRTPENTANSNGGDQIGHALIFCNMSTVLIAIVAIVYEIACIFSWRPSICRKRVKGQKKVVPIDSTPGGGRVAPATIVPTLTKGNVPHVNDDAAHD